MPPQERKQMNDPDVYAVTFCGGTYSNKCKYKYWKNGVETQPFNIDGFVCGSDFHIRGDIYRAGTEKHSNGREMAIIKKNGFRLYYLTDGIFGAGANRVFVSGSDVYAAGCESNNPQGKLVATVWKNGKVLYRLTNGSFDADAYSLYVSGGDVYAGGWEQNSHGKKVAAVWKNGRLLYSLTNENFDAEVESLYVTSGDVYAAGYEKNSQCKCVATVWKNGRLLYSLTNENFNTRHRAVVHHDGRYLYRLTNENFNTAACSLYVSGGDVYVAGWERNTQGDYVYDDWSSYIGCEEPMPDNFVATVWKNDKVLYRLPAEQAVLVQAVLVFVR
jgi:hypothetical protein